LKNKIRLFILPCDTCNMLFYERIIKMRIIADSSANLIKPEKTDFVSVPMKVIISDQECSDTPSLDVENMMQAMENTKEKTSTACPGIGEWLEAFGEEEELLVFTLTGTLSGCYNAAVIASQQYLEEHPERKVSVIDTLSTGPEMELLVEKCAALAEAGASYEEVCDAAKNYSSETGLLFMLATLDNFARNGRVSPALAKLIGVLNIHIVGRASDAGELEPLHKCRGEKKSIDRLWKEMLEEGYRGGKVRIRHTDNKAAAKSLIRLIVNEYPDADIRAGSNRGLCSYYAERGGILVGFEKEPAVGTAEENRETVPKESKNILQESKKKLLGAKSILSKEFHVRKQ